MGYEGSYMLVPQGEDMDEWVWCIKQIIRHRGDRVSSIGIPRDLPFGRDKAIMHCMEDVEMRHYMKFGQRFHLLGVREPLTQLYIFNDLPVRSVNTKWPVLAGMKLQSVENCNDLPEQDGFEIAPINAYAPMPVDEDTIYNMIHTNVQLFLREIREESNYAAK